MKAALLFVLTATAMAQTVVPAGGAQTQGIAGSCAFDTNTSSGDLRCCSVMQPSDAVPQCMQPPASGTPPAPTVVTAFEAARYCCKVTQKCCPNSNAAQPQISGCVEAYQECPTGLTGPGDTDFSTLTITDTPDATLVAANTAAGCAVCCGTSQECATAIYGGTSSTVCCASGQTFSGTAAPFTCVSANDSDSWFRRFFLWMWLRRIFQGYWQW